MGSVAGAVPKSNSGRAKGYVLPWSTVNCDSSTGSVISGAGIAGAACCWALDRCTRDSVQNISATRLTVSNLFEAEGDFMEYLSPGFSRARGGQTGRKEIARRLSLRRSSRLRPIFSILSPDGLQLRA